MAVMIASLASALRRSGYGGVAGVIKTNPAPAALACLLSNSFATTTTDSATAKQHHPDARCVNVRNAPEGFDAASAVVYPNFVTEEEGKSLIKEASKRLKRRRFENGHWDAVITGYREVEMPTPDEEYMREQLDGNKKDEALPLFAKIIEETRGQLASHHINRNDKDAPNNKLHWLPCHAIDLSADGVLSAHVDSIKFSGGIVAGISLLSDSIMRLRPSSKEWDGEEEQAAAAAADDGKLEQGGCSSDDDSNDGYADLYLPQLSLYVLSGMSRYDYTHELLPSDSAFELSDTEDSLQSEQIDVARGRRLSIIFRDQHQSSNS